MSGRIVAGIGARPGTDAEQVRTALSASLDRAAVEPADLAGIWTLDSRAPALREVGRRFGVPVTGVPARTLAAHPVPHPSAVAAEAVGTGSVAEAAVLAAGAELISDKQVWPGVTVALGRLVTDPFPDGSVGVDLRHHGDAEVGPGLTDLAVNVRGTTPAWLRARLRDAVDRLEAYPDPVRATAAVARRHGREVGEVLLTAGAAEAFTLIARALAPRLAVVVHPQFTEPEAALLAAGHRVHRAVLAPPFTLDAAALDAGAVPADADLVVVGNPTNPTSVLHPREAVLALAAPGRVLVVDEAFMDAVPGEPESLAGGHGFRAPSAAGPVLVVRSLTKTWGLAGLRIGYLLGDPAVLRACRAVQPPWSVGTIGLEAALACSTPAAVAEADAWARDLVWDRRHLVAALARVPGVAVAGPASASFVLLRVGGPDPAGVHGRLRGGGWAVRRADTFPGLGPGWLRAAVRDPATSDAFAAALDHAITHYGGQP